MRRANRHGIKHEKPETSSAFTRAMEEHDLAYYIHDRVELMHQVFSVLKAKDLKAMAPECVRRLTIDDLQELCTEELLGISSKRLLAILDGAEPPSDTESSSQSSEHMEAISLDSISSDEEILSQGTKKKHKHKRRDSKAKKHKSKKPVEVPVEDQDPEKSKASRAGLTVLELLELQARARAIRAQLQQEQAKRSEAVQSVTGVESSQTSDSDIEVKEEPAEVVEIISSDDEKPQIDKLENAVTPANKEPEKTVNNTTPAEETTKKTNESAKNKKKKDKSKKKERKRKESSNSKDSDKTTKEAVPSSSKEVDKAKEKENTEKSPRESPASIETDSTAKSALEESQRVTKRVNDLIITVPQQSTRKIKLNRNKMTVSISNSAKNEVVVTDNSRPVSSVVSRPEKLDTAKKISSVVSRPRILESVVQPVDNYRDKMAKAKQDNNIDIIAEKSKNKDKSKKKQKKKEKRHSIDEDHDEITLQLSDSEKMDLLENFDKRNYDNVSSSSSDSDSSSDSSNDSNEAKDKSKDLDKTQNKTEDSSQNSTVNAIKDDTENVSKIPDSEHEVKRTENIDSVIEKSDDNVSKTDDAVTEIAEQTSNDNKEENNHVNDLKISTDVNENNKDIVVEENIVGHECLLNNESPEITTELTGNSTEEGLQNVIVISKIDNIPAKDNSEKESQDVSNSEQNQNRSPKNLESKESPKTGNEKNDDANSEQNQNISPKDLEGKKSPKTGDKKNDDGTLVKEHVEEPKCSDKELSEGEISERESSEVEAFELQPEVVCISDDETPKKKKKKDKKSKKDKKKKSDFRESADQNFFKDSGNQGPNKIDATNQEDKQESITLDDNDDAFEILELSDDSSCYEVEGTTLSKEPTVEEIAALSAKIDEIEREEVVTEQEIQIYEQRQKEKNKILEETSSNEEIEKISWKDRYLDSKKVKKVLTTSNILNALRKKNKELKKKMEDSKKKEQELDAQRELEEKNKEKQHTERDNVLEEGSIEHYNTLEASTKFVDPVPDPVELAKKREEELKEQQMKEAEIMKEKEREVEQAIEAQVTGEMKKDAKQLLKMYRKLLKYNDINKQKDPHKKKSKKKKKKEKDSVSCSAGQ